MKPTRLPPASRTLAFAERVALYAYSLHRDRLPDLLEGLAAGPRKSAERYVEELKAADSATRQARLSLEFGTLPDALERVQQLIVEASPALRCALVRHLPPPLRARFSHLERPADATPAAMDAFAARLVREVLRASTTQ
ncbi:MAG: hypothetical protein AB1938_11540 [Myxococcota bacterium]